MDRDGPGANRDSGDQPTVESRRGQDYTPAEASRAIRKYGPCLEGDSVVLLTALDAVSKSGDVTGDQRAASASGGRAYGATRICLRVLALLLMGLAIASNHVFDGSGWAMLVAFVLGWFAGDLWSYSTHTFAAVYKTIGHRKSLSWNLILFSTGIAAVLMSVLILTHVSEQDWAPILSIVLGWLTGWHYHRCRASFDLYLDRVRLA
ncbi:MAG: hypothetical protein AAGC96_06640 [Pseudomonadota bacterium]